MSPTHKSYRKRNTIVLLLLALLALNLPCFADDDEPINPDRPDFTNGPNIVPLGRTQLEMGYTFSRQGSSVDHAVGEFLLRRALNKQTELRLLFNSFHVTEDSGFTTSGFDDFGLEVKWKFLEGSEQPLKRPSLGLLAGITFPSGSGQYRQNRLRSQLALVAALPLTEAVEVQSSLGYQDESDSGDILSQFFFSTSFSFKLSKKWGAFSEYYTLLPGSRGGSNANYFDSGLTYLLNNDTQLDFRAGIGLNSQQPDYFVGAGISLRF